MSDDEPLLGRVVVVAGAADVLAAVADGCAAAGAFVALVAPERHDGAVHASFRTDPYDPQVWDRVAPHVEQRLGPVDAVVTDERGRAVVTAVFEPDLRRRGHGAVVVVAPGDDAPAVVSRVARLHRAAPR